MQIGKGFVNEPELSTVNTSRARLSRRPTEAVAPGSRLGSVCCVGGCPSLSTSLTPLPLLLLSLLGMEKEDEDREEGEMWKGGEC